MRIVRALLLLVVPQVCGAETQVVTFLGVDCPLAKLYAIRLNDLHREYGDRVAFKALNVGDPEEAVREFGKRLEFPIARDAGEARELGATRSPETFLLVDGVVRYQGRIDDEYAPGNRGVLRERYLANAIESLLAGREIAMPRTEAVGCRLPEVKPITSKLTYRDVVPIINKHCVECHRPGQVAPFDLLSYAQVSFWATTIAEVIEQRRMPPWSADPQYGHFSNDRSLPAGDCRLLLDWIQSGAAEGAGDLPPTPHFPEDWQIGKPDVILAMPQDFHVPAQGTLELQRFIIETGFKSDTWLRAVEIKPGNRAVVHHASIYLQPPGATSIHAVGALKSNQLAMYVPGQVPFQLPEGLAKRVPAGWQMVLEIHYITNGEAQTDRTQIGLLLADPGREVATQIAIQTNFTIRPFTVEQFSFAWPIDRDTMLLSLFPHMHLRGRSMQFEARYPDGHSEMLLSVPKYDFLWQHRYILVEPKLLPAGSQVILTAVFDNSSANPKNPDPAATVKYGNLTTDEMFQGYFDVYLAQDEPWLAKAARGLWEQLPAYRQPIVLCGLFGLCAIVYRSRRRKLS